MLFNHNDENTNEVSNIESYLEYKKTQNSINVDDSEDTLFSSTNYNNTASSSSSNNIGFKTINIKISAATTIALGSKPKASPPSNNTSPNSSNGAQDSSPYSTPTNSPPIIVNLLKSNDDKIVSIGIESLWNIINFDEENDFKQYTTILEQYGGNLTSFFY